MVSFNLDLYRPVRTTLVQCGDSMTSFGLFCEFCVYRVSRFRLINSYTR